MSGRPDMRADLLIVEGESIGASHSLALNDDTDNMLHYDNHGKCRGGGLRGRYDDIAFSCVCEARAYRARRYLKAARSSQA